MTKTFSTRLHLINSFFLKYYILQILPIRIKKYFKRKWFHTFGKKKKRKKKEKNI